MSAPKDPLGIETVSPAFGGEASWDADVRRRQQNYLHMVGSGRDLQQEHWTRLHGGAASSAGASGPPDLGGAAILLAVFLVPAPVLLPPGWLGWMAWGWARWHQWHSLFSIGAALAVFALALAVWMFVIVALPRLAWILAGLAGGGILGAMLATANRLDAVWTGFIALCAGGFVAMWFLGLWALLARWLGSEDDRSTRLAMAGSTLGLLVPPAILALIVVQSPRFRNLPVNDPGFQSLLTLAAIAAAAMAVIALVRFVPHLWKGMLNAALLDALTIVAGVMLALVAGASDIVDLLKIRVGVVDRTTYVMDSFGMDAVIAVAVALVSAFLLRRVIVQWRR